jgi:hypothetical protein
MLLLSLPPIAAWWSAAHSSGTHTLLPKERRKDRSMSDTGATEVLGRTWLTAELTRAGIEVARPERDMGVDLITYSADASWMLPIQLKTIGLSGITVYQKYVGMPIGIIYVLLGDDHGGAAGRPETTAYLLTPEAAWNLPTTLEMKFDPEDHTTYRFASLTRTLTNELEPHRVQPGTWAERLILLAPLRRDLPTSQVAIGQAMDGHRGLLS